MSVSLLFLFGCAQHTELKYPKDIKTCLEKSKINKNVHCAPPPKYGNKIV